MPQYHRQGGGLCRSRERLHRKTDDHGVLIRNRNTSGSLIRAVDYIQAQRKRLKMALELAEVLTKYDALVTANFSPFVKLDPSKEVRGRRRTNHNNNNN